MIKMKQSDNKPYAILLEQPVKSVRFRYANEGRNGGSIVGVNSTAEYRTFVAIEVVNYKGPAIVVVSCVSHEPPFYPHPHNLVGRQGCKRGICKLRIANPDMKIEFTSMGIQCVKKSKIVDSLLMRERINVLPFGNCETTRVRNLKAVRLCFQVFLEDGPENVRALPPILSTPIFDSRSMIDLQIIRISQCHSPVGGGQEIIILCEKVNKEDIAIRFIEGDEESPTWVAYGIFQPENVHKQVAVAFLTPPYYNENICCAAKVKIQLLRRSDGATSEPYVFEYLPILLIDVPEFSSMYQKKDDEMLLTDILQLQDSYFSEKFITEADGHLNQATDILNLPSFDNLMVHIKECREQ